jgi:hypothetical protein
MKRALDIRVKVLGPNHSDVGGSTTWASFIVR